MIPIDELQAQQQALTDEIRAQQERLRVLAHTISDRQVAEALEADLAGLERKHGVHLVRPVGIQSAEGVNGQ